MTNNRSFEEIVQDAAIDLGEGPGIAEKDLQSGTLLDSVQALKEKENRRVRPYTIASVAAAAGILVSLSFIWLYTRVEPLPFSFGDHQIGEVSELLQAQSDAPLAIRFRGGSHITFQKQSRGRVLESNADKVRVVLETGGLAASIKGNGHTRWSVIVGPYEVQVIGTRFTVDWDSDNAQLQVQVTRGEVMVTGRWLSEHGVSVEAGNQLMVDGQKESFAVYRNLEEGVNSEKSKLDTDGPLEMDESANNNVEEGPSNETKSTGGTPASHQHRNKWRQLYKQNKYKEALDAWSATGSNSIHTATAAELWDLANAARYAKNQPLSRELLLAIRTRFPRSKQAEAAVFLLGKNALELSHNPQKAARWFEKYLNTYNSGPMAENAIGRLIRIYRDNGNINKAKKLAITYLDRFPNGTFAKLATSMHNE